MGSSRAPPPPPPGPSHTPWKSWAPARHPPRIPTAPTAATARSEIDKEKRKDDRLRERYRASRRPLRSTMSPARRYSRQGGRLRLGMGGRFHVGMGGRLRRNPHLGTRTPAETL